MLSNVGRLSASKVIGSDVLNNADVTIGKVDDLLISPDGTAPYIVLSSEWVPTLLSSLTTASSSS